MDKLEFSINWNNKLDCKCFTTIRIFNPMKHFNGKEFEINLKWKYKGKAVVIGITKAYLDELNDYVCFLDTGYNKEETKILLQKMYPKINFKNQQLVIMLLKKIDPIKQKQETIFN